MEPISVIVLNFNGRQWLGPCLDAVAGQRGAPEFEIVLVDNGSSDGSIPFVRERYPQVRLVDTGSNLGFAGGNNAGARAARASMLVFLNNDTVVAPDWLAKLHAHAQRHAPDAIVTSRIVSLAQPAVVDSAGDGYLLAGGAYKRGYGMDAKVFQEAREVFGACGAAFLIPRRVFEELGGFDDRFFMVYEDVDLSYRARLAGYRIWYAPDAVVRHAGSATLGRASAGAVFHGQRNLEWTWIKNTPASLLIRTAPAHVAYSVVGVLHYVRTGQVGAALKGKLAAIAGLGAVIRERRRVQRERRATTAAIAAAMDRGWIRQKLREKSARLDLPDHQQRGLS